MPSADPLKGAYVHAAAWGDVNGDGYPDLYVGMFTDSRRSYYQFRGANGPSPNRLFLNNRNGTFTVESDSPPSALTGRTAGAVFADVDNDGRLDLVVSENTYPSGQVIGTCGASPFQSDAAARCSAQGCWAPFVFRQCR